MMDQLVNFLIDPAHAESVMTQNAQSGNFSFMLMFLVFFIFLYFAIWRPQNRRAKEQQNLLNSLTKGDEVATAAGILGRITKMTDQYITVTVANNVDVLMQKSAVVNVLPKGTLKSIE